MEVTYREACLEDLPACLDLFEESVSDMRARHNIASPPQPAGRPRLEVYRHCMATGIFHVAEADGRIIAFASAIVRNHLWFLSAFWARPGLQERHIGMPLLRSVRKAGEQRGARTFFVWSSIDLPAMAAYMKVGMLPGSQILVFGGAPQLKAEAASGYASEPFDGSFAATLDEAVLGIRREMDHEFLRGAAWHGRQVTHAGRPVGYFYVHEGIIGPAAWTDPRHAVALLTLACSEASAAGAGASIMVPGMNHDALRFCFGAGLRLTGFAHLFTSAPFGQLEQYLPSGPALF